MTNKRNIDIIVHISRYCDEIKGAIDLFGDDKSIFLNNAIYRNAVAMPIEQIGELAKHLSDDFLSQHSEMPWKDIKGMRIWFAHQYLSMDKEIIWKVMHEDIPQLKKFCLTVVGG